MNAELLKAFDKVINFYKTRPEYLDVIGTELYEKMYALECETLAFCNAVESYDGDYYNCDLCGCCCKIDSGIEVINHELNAKTLRLMFPDENLYNKLMNVHKYSSWNICCDCCEFYGYDGSKHCHISEINTNEICEFEKQLLDCSSDVLN